MSSGRLRSDTNLVQHRIHKIARTIACERPARAVGTMRARRQAQNQDARIGIAEPRHRLAPILPIQIRSPFFTGNLAAVVNEPWTTSAGNNIGIQLSKPGRHSLILSLDSRTLLDNS